MESQVMRTDLFPLQIGKKKGYTVSYFRILTRTIVFIQINKNSQQLNSNWFPICCLCPVFVNIGHILGKMISTEIGFPSSLFLAGG